jgi:serine/threonine-protein kinase
MAFAEGQIVGSYRILSLLGMGGMATVYKAYHPKLDRYVALKMMHTAFLSDPQFVARFEREAQIIARLEHPNIVPVHDYAEHDGQPYLIMKYIEGITLKDALSDGPLELRDTVIIFSAVCAALDYAHRQGVLHRDIKPSNIMLDTATTPYLTDFGLARTVNEGESSLSRGMLIGTPTYMSPEQASGERALDYRSDLYSLGIVLYELIVGRVPFEGNSTYTILHSHQTVPPPIPSEINAEIPPAVEVVLLQALAKDPSDRYPSAGAMLEALKSALVASQLRRLNPDERHSLASSIGKPRPERRPTGMSTPRARSANTPDSTASAARSDLPVPAQGRALVREPARSSTSAFTWVILGVAVTLTLLIVGFALLNRGSGAAVAQEPTVKPTELPTMTALPTRQPLPTAMPTLTTAPVEATIPMTVPETQPAPPDASGERGMFASLPNDIELYPVERLSLSEAEAAVEREPSDGVAYLNLALAQIDERRRADEILDTLDRGAVVTDDIVRYSTTIADMFEGAPIAPDVLFYVYDNLLVDTYGTTVYEIIRQRAGFHLYDLASRRGLIPTFVILQLSDQVDDSYDSLFPAAVARMLITDNRLPLAQLALSVGDPNSPEIILVRGDLYQAQGELDRARQEWQRLIDGSGIPVWVRLRAEEQLAQAG